MKIPAAKAAVDKEWEKLEKIPAWDLTKVRSKIRSDRWSKDEGRYSSFCIINGHMSSEKCWIGDKTPKIQRSSCTPRRRCEETILDLMQYSQNKDHQHLKWRQQKSWISYTDCQDAQDKQLTQYLLLPKVKMEDAHKILENSKIGMSRHLDSSTTTQMAKIMVQYGRPSRSSWAKSVWSSFGRTVMGKTIWENPIEVRLGEGFHLGMLNRTPWKKFILICVCDDITLAGKKI